MGSGPGRLHQGGEQGSWWSQYQTMRVRKIAYIAGDPSLVRGLGFPADARSVGGSIPGGKADAGPLAASRLGLAVSRAEFSYPFNMSWNPAASVPCRFTAEGLPVGLQVVGQQLNDLGVLQAAAAFEQAQPSAESGRNSAGRGLSSRPAGHAFLLGFPALFSIVNPIAGAFFFREHDRGAARRAARRPAPAR